LRFAAPLASAGKMKRGPAQKVFARAERLTGRDRIISKNKRLSSSILRLLGALDKETNRAEIEKLENELSRL
jgi:hypothetical protein